MKKNRQTIKEALHSFLIKYNLQKGFIETKTKFLWGEIMGRFIRHYTEKISIKDQVIHVKLKAPELRQDLFYRKKEIIGRINKKLGYVFVKDIMFYQITLLINFYINLL